jgi:lactate permease
MPVDQTLLVTLEGAAFGLFPILWIIINAIWIYNLTVKTGDFAILRRSFAAISDDKRIQAMIVAFAFGALIEGLAGFGTPVAITSVMLIALGFNPIKAAVLALVGNTAPVAFGSIATPIITLANITGLPREDLGAMLGRQTPILALFVPSSWPSSSMAGAACARRGGRTS